MTSKAQKAANIMILSIIFILLTVLFVGASRDKERRTLENDQIARAREVQSAVENYIYLNYGRQPQTVYQKGRDKRTICNFLPGQRKLKNLATGQETEPRDWAEYELNGGPDRYAIYYRPILTEQRYVIYCYGSLSKEPLIVLEGR